MTRFTVVSILPEIVDGALAVGVVGRARAAGGLPIAFVNPRDFTHDRHRSVDDTPYGGGPGMVMRCEPLAAVYSGHQFGVWAAASRWPPRSTPPAPATGCSSAPAARR